MLVKDFCFWAGDLFDRWIKLKGLSFTNNDGNAFLVVDVIRDGDHIYLSLDNDSEVPASHRLSEFFVNVSITLTPEEQQRARGIWSFPKTRRFFETVYSISSRDFPESKILNPKIKGNAVISSIEVNIPDLEIADSLKQYCGKKVKVNIHADTSKLALKELIDMTTDRTLTIINGPNGGHILSFGNSRIEKLYIYVDKKIN